jgi:dGTPase
MKGNGGFEGNAQTLRILSRVEKKVFREGEDNCGIDSDGSDRRLGLNLTFRSLAAVLKYDKEIKLKRDKGAGLQKGYYASERKLVAAIKKSVGTPPKGRPFKTIECQIMDIADDIAYSTYDLEDGMKGGFTHPMALASRVFGDEGLFEKLQEKVSKEVPDVKHAEIYQAAVDLLIFDKDAPALEQYTQSKLIASDGRLRSEFSSQLVGAFMRGVSVRRLKGADQRFSELVVERGIKIKIETLKHLNFLLTIMSPKLKVVEYRGYDVIKTIFDTLDADGGRNSCQTTYRKCTIG